MKNSYSRREFLRVSALGSVGMKAGLLGLDGIRIAQAQTPTPAQSAVIPNAPAIRVGIIGTGARAARHIAALHAIPGFRIVAAADVDQDRLARGVALSGEKVAAYTDYQNSSQTPKSMRCWLPRRTCFIKSKLLPPPKPVSTY